MQRPTDRRVGRRGNVELIMLLEACDADGSKHRLRKEKKIAQESVPSEHLNSMESCGWTRSSSSEPSSSSSSDSDSSSSSSLSKVFLFFFFVLLALSFALPNGGRRRARGPGSTSHIRHSSTDFSRPLAFRTLRKACGRRTKHVSRDETMVRSERMNHFRIKLALNAERLPARE